MTSYNNNDKSERYQRHKNKTNNLHDNTNNNSNHNGNDKRNNLDEKSNCDIYIDR